MGLLQQLVNALPLVGPVLAPIAAFFEEFYVPIVIALLAILVTQYIRASFFDPKDRIFGVRTNIEGPGVAYRHSRFLALLETPVDGIFTVPALFNWAAKKFRTRPLLGTRQLIKREFELDEASGKKFEKLTLGSYSFDSYERVHERAVDFGSGLLALGHKKEEKLAIFAETRADWYIALQGAFQQGIAVVTVYASLGDDALIHSLNETEVTTVICDSKQLTKILSAGSQLASVSRVVYMSEPDEDVAAERAEKTKSAPEAWSVVPFLEVEQKGKEAAIPPNLPEPSDLAVIMYTSGSTGLPKGVMMLHSNLVAVIAGVIAVVPNITEDDVYFAYLPLAHVLELAAETGLTAMGISIGYGTPLTMVDSGNKLKKGCRGDVPTLRPTLMAAVPAILDRIRTAVLKVVDSRGGTVKKLFDLACRRRLAAIEGSLLGAWGLEKKIYDAVVFRKIRSGVGGRLRFMLSGGAPLSPDTQRFMNICFGIPVGQGYGLTETCAGATFLEWRDSSVGRVGPPIPCGVVKLIDWEEGGYRTTDKPLPRGEICIGGNSVTAGYWKNEEKTKEVYSVDRSGMRWFHTGDIGQFHPDGVLEIVDRKKDIVKLQAGEYVALGKVEAALQASPYVDNVMVHADPLQSFVVAIIVPSAPKIVALAKEKGLEDADNVEALLNDKEIVAAISKSLLQAGKEARLEKFEIPAKIKLLPEAWTPESGLVTAALKLKREAIRKRFSSELAALYA